MKRIALILCLLMAGASTVYAHGGGTDKNGCHKDHSTGTKHCH